MFRPVLCLLLASLAGSVVAQDERSALTLDDAVALALAHHPGILAREGEREAARALQRQAALRANPEVSLGAGLKRTDADSGYVANAELLFPVERAGKRGARIAGAQADAALAEAALLQLRRDLDLEVRSLACEYLVAAADAEIARDIAARSRAVVDLLKQRPAAGPTQFLELRVMQGSLVEFEATARSFEAQRDTARASLNVLLHREAGAPLALDAALDTPDSRFDFDALASRIERSPAVLSRLAALEKAMLEARAASLDAKTDFSVGPFVSREEAGEAETAVGVAIAMPLAWRNRNQGAIAAAEARRQGAEAELAAEVRSARGELARRLRLYEAALAQLDVVPQTAVRELRDAADLADRQVRLGAIPVQLYLEMQREFLAAQHLRHAALLEALRHEAELQWLARAVEAP